MPLLLWRGSRPFAYVLVVVFHGLTSVLFHIGMFPWIMMLSAPLFFDPSWPAAALWGDGVPPRSDRAATGQGTELSRVGLLLLALYASAQLLLPLRHFLYPGNTLWTEEVSASLGGSADRKERARSSSRWWMPRAVARPSSRANT